MNKIAATICQYIDENYANPMLSRSFIAEQLGFSVSYLSHVLKEQNNQTVMNLIHKKRIAEAKKLLITSSLNLQEIAERIGYTNTWTFSRAFRSIENISPGKYRDCSN